MKKTLAIILTVILLLSSVNTFVFATEVYTLTLGDTVAVTEDNVTYTFTTEEAGAYIMFSQGEGCLCALLYNSEGNCVTSAFQNAEDGRGFYIEMVLGANSTYSIEVYNRYPEEVPTDYELNVEKLESDGTLAVGTEAKINKKEAYHSFTPTVSGYYFIYTTGTCDTYGELYNSNGVKVYNDENLGMEGNYRLEYYLTAGEDYVVYTKSWYAYEEYDIGLFVIPFSVDVEVEEGEVHTVTDKWGILSFVAPKTATYRFYSVEEEDEDYNTDYYGKIYNSDYEVISYENEEIYSANNFYVECEMTAGETYYLDSCMLWYNEYSPQTYNVTIGEVSPITSLEIVPLDGTVAGVNEDLHCELIINPEVHKSEEIFWSITPERVGRIEYGGNWGASIELRSPGIAEVVAYTASGVSASYTVTCSGELPALEINKTQKSYIEYSDEIHAYSFTAKKEGYYGFLSKGDALDLKVAVYEKGETSPFKTETSKGAGDNFNIQFYNLTPGTEYIIEVAVEYDEHDYENHSGNYEIISYVPTNEIKGIKLSVGDTYTVYADGQPYKFSASLIPETADLSALEYAVWNLEGDDIGFQSVYGRSFVSYGFYNAGVATLTVSIESGKFTASSVITSKQVGYNDIALDEVKTIYGNSHQSEGWFRFTALEDGEYTFYSTGKADTYMMIYDSEYDNSYTVDDDSGYRYNFLYTTELKAGEKLSFEAYVYDSDAYEFNVSVCKKHSPESVSIVKNSSDKLYGLYSAVMGNGGATYDKFDELVWTISDKSVAEVAYYFDDGTIELYYCKNGVATLTVETPEGFTASYTFCSGMADVNEDDNFDILDLVRMKSILSKVDFEWSETADVDENGEITAQDLSLIKKMLLAFF